ncbi:MAG: hypothetical protein LBR80_01565, partial [Deltaproteobacteria bacterium]|nr:hypothetical protein [Deltaproteobacteria bacterium]
NRALVRERAETLRRDRIPLPPAVDRAVQALLADGELDAASDLITEAVHRELADAPPMRLPEGVPSSRTEEFFRLLPELKGAADFFAAAREAWGDSRAARGARPPVTGPAERIWMELADCIARECSETEAAQALEKLLKWLDLGAGKGFRAMPGGWGGGDFPWREYSAEALFTPVLPAWGEGPKKSLSVMVWQGEGASPGHLIEALEEWRPATGSVPLAVSLAPLTPGGRGLLWAWAREARRDVAVLDPALMAVTAVAAPSLKAARREWLFTAGGVYGAYAPYRHPIPRAEASGADGLAESLVDSKGLVRLEGPVGVGKSSLLRLVLDDPAVSKPSDGNWACLLDWTGDVSPALQGRGPLSAALHLAASRLSLPGWNLTETASANLARLEASRGRKGYPAQFTVMVDDADGMMGAIALDPADTALLNRAVTAQGAFRLILAGRRLSRRLERHPASPLAALPSPLALRAPEAEGLWEALTAPLIASGWIFETPSLPYRILARAYWNHGALAVLITRVLEEAARDIPIDAPPPFVVTERAVSRAAADPETEDALRGLAASALEADPLHRALALVASYMEHAGEREFEGAGLSLAGMLQNLKDFWPEAFRDAELDEIRYLATELARFGLLALDPRGMRFRSAALARLMGDQDRVLDELSALKDLPVPPDASLLSARRLIPPTDSLGESPDVSLTEAGRLAGRVPASIGPDAVAADALDFSEDTLHAAWAATLLGRNWSVRPDGACGAGNGNGAGVNGGEGEGAIGGNGTGVNGGRWADANGGNGKGNGSGNGANGASSPGDAKPGPGANGGAPRRLPVPSPLTLLQETELFERAAQERPFTLVTGSPASGADRAPVALASLCAMEDSSGASAALFIRIRGEDGCVTRTDVRRAFDTLKPVSRQGRRIRVVADSMTCEGPGGKRAFDELAAFAGAKDTRRQDDLAVCYLCRPGEALARADGLPDRSARAYAQRWTLGAVELYLKMCGLDPVEAHGIMKRTGGWDALVLAEARALAGIPAERPGSAAFPDWAPVELAGFVSDLRGLGPVTAAEAAGLYEGVDEGGRAEIRALMGELAGLTVLLPAGERDGETVWTLDPRFA